MFARAKLSNDAYGGAEPQGGALTNRVNTEIARRLRTRRRLMGMTLEEVGRGAGMSYKTVHKYESGAVAVSAATLYRLAEALAVEPGYFFSGLQASA